MDRRMFCFGSAAALAGCGGSDAMEYQIQPSPRLRTSKNTFEAGVFESWTPTFSCAVPGDLSVSYAKQRGHAVRIGNLIQSGFFLQFTPTRTTASGNIEIHGSPWVNLVDTETNIGFADATITLTAGRQWLFCAVSITGTTYHITLNEGGGGANSTPIGVSKFTSGVEYRIRCVVTYFSTRFT